MSAPALLGLRKAYRSLLSPARGLAARRGCTLRLDGLRHDAPLDAPKKPGCKIRVSRRAQEKEKECRERRTRLKAEVRWPNAVEEVERVVSIQILYVHQATTPRNPGEVAQIERIRAQKSRTILEMLFG